MVDSSAATAAAAGYSWPGLPYPALLTAAGVALLTILVVIAAHRFDATGGLLTLSVMLVLGFIAVTLASMIYEVPQTPTTEILLGALATSVGGIIAFWMSRRGNNKDADKD